MRRGLQDSILVESLICSLTTVIPMMVVIVVDIGVDKKNNVLEK